LAQSQAALRQAAAAAAKDREWISCPRPI